MYNLNINKLCYKIFTLKSKELINLNGGAKINFKFDHGSFVLFSINVLPDRYRLKYHDVVKGCVIFRWIFSVKMQATLRPARKQSQLVGRQAHRSKQKSYMFDYYVNKENFYLTENLLWNFCFNSSFLATKTSQF